MQIKVWLLGISSTVWRRVLVPNLHPARAARRDPDVLPVASGTNATILRQHVLRVAERAEGELGKEQSSFIDGCPAGWAD